MKFELLKEVVPRKDVPLCGLHWVDRRRREITMFEGGDPGNRENYTNDLFRRMNLTSSDPRE
ncbi:hypothetical protein RJ641_002190, partial [Dillenia turbinata]